MRLKTISLALAATGAISLGALASTTPAFAATQSYQATLAPLNNSNASGTLMITLNGDQATVTEHASGLAATFNNAPYPHVQHIHINGQGQCPDDRGRHERRRRREHDRGRPRIRPDRHDAVDFGSDDPRGRNRADGCTEWRHNRLQPHLHNRLGDDVGDSGR